MSVGWIPGVGTVINGLSLVSDFLDFTIAAVKGDTADMRDEIGDMTLDVIGMIPIVGGPLAATIHQAIAPTVTPPNHAPSAVNDSFTTNENTQLTGNVLTDDTDVDGDALTAAVNTVPVHGSLTLNANGSFTYTPAENFYGTDTFSYTVADGKGGTAVGIASITVKSVDPAPVVDQQHPYSVDGSDPGTGKISGHFNVTDDDPLTYKLVTAPDPTVGTFELDEQTGEWSFTPYPRTRVLAGYFAASSPAAVKVTFAVTATDGISTTAPIAVSENIAASQSAALSLPAGTLAVMSFVDARTGDAYIVGYHGDPFSAPDDQTFSYITAVIHSDGSYSIPTTGNPAVGLAANAFTADGTTYVVTRIVDSSDSYRSFLSEVGPDGLTTIAGSLPGVFHSSIAVGNNLYLVSEAGDYESGYHTHLTALGPDGLTPTTSIPGSFYGRSIVVADTTYLVSETGDYESGYQTHLTALKPDGLTSTTSIPGQFHEDSDGYSIVAGGTKYLVTKTGDYESGYETHVTALGPDGVTPTISISGSTEQDPIVIGDTTYLLMTPYSRIVTHVLALTSAGAVPVGSIPGVLSGDPIVVGGTTYLISETGDYADPDTWQTFVTTLAPTLGGITVLGDPISGYRYGHSPIVVGNTTYLVTETWNSIIGSQTNLTSIGPGGPTPVITDIPGRMWSDSFVVIVGDTTYLATTTSYYYPGDATNTYEFTYLTGLGPDGPAPELGPVPGYPGTGPIVVGDTTYLVMESDAPSTGYHIQLVSVAANGLTPIGDPVPGRVNPHNDLDVIVVGDTTYLAVQISDPSGGEQTSLLEVGPDGVTPGLGTLPGHPSSPPVVIGDTTYLVTQTGEYDSAQTYFTAVGSDGALLPGSSVAGEVSAYESIVVAGDIAYVVTVEWERVDVGSYSVNRHHVTALASDGLESVDLPSTYGWKVAVGDTTYLGSPWNADDGGDDKTYVLALTPDGLRPLADPLTGFAFPPISLGDTAYLTSMTGDPASGLESYTTYVVALAPQGPVTLADPFPGALTGTSDAIFAVGDTRYITTTAGVWAIGVDRGANNRSL
ncbi:Ig-like domain-containing protein [Mycobacterium sp. RTGN5]|uniref:Ig-like domain-containing protein n=1 Tax=Mycobacterium sp. RTGN5 TaxID=3016522 RepID=UPI0029C71F33|nr:Ig-like domain-containing protein [Mycobacterium sp. RTGN5]